MTSWEKIYCLLAILCGFGLIASLFLFPQLRVLDRLVPLCLLGLTTNMGLLVIVLRDIFARPFADPVQRYLWLALVLLFWPTILVYLPRHGFRPRTI